MIQQPSIQLILANVKLSGKQSPSNIRTDVVLISDNEEFFIFYDSCTSYLITKNGKILLKLFSGIQSFCFSKDSQFLAIQFHRKVKTKVLIYNLETQTIQSFHEIVFGGYYHDNCFVFHKNTLLYLTRTEIRQIILDGTQNELIKVVSKFFYIDQFMIPFNNFLLVKHAYHYDYIYCGKSLFNLDFYCSQRWKIIKTFRTANFIDFIQLNKFLVHSINPEKFTELINGKLIRKVNRPWFVVKICSARNKIYYFKDVCFSETDVFKGNCKFYQYNLSEKSLNGNSKYQKQAYFYEYKKKQIKGKKKLKVNMNLYKFFA